MSRIDLLINRSTEARTASPVFFEFHYKGLADFEGVLMEKNLLKIKGDCMSFSNINIEILNKAGQQFRNEFFNNFENESQVIFFIFFSLYKDIC